MGIAWTHVVTTVATALAFLLFSTIFKEKVAPIQYAGVLASVLGIWMVTKRAGCASSPCLGSSRLKVVCGEAFESLVAISDWASLGCRYLPAGNCKYVLRRHSRVTWPGQRQVAGERT